MRTSPAGWSQIWKLEKHAFLFVVKIPNSRASHPWPDIRYTLIDTANCHQFVLGFGTSSGFGTESESGTGTRYYPYIGVSSGELPYIVCPICVDTANWRPINLCTFLVCTVFLELIDFFPFILLYLLGQVYQVTNYILRILATTIDNTIRTIPSNTINDRIVFVTKMLQKVVVISTLFLSFFFTVCLLHRNQPSHAEKICDWSKSKYFLRIWCCFYCFFSTNLIAK